MMIEINYKGMFACLGIILVLMILMVGFTVSSGCISAAKKIGKDVLATPTPTPTPPPIPSPTPTPTPVPTPESIPTFHARYVDPFAQSERWEGQWFKWLRQDVQGINSEGKKDLFIGIITYRHAFVDKLTYYSNLWGQYFEEKPSDGNRYFVAWVHEEMMGDNQSYDPSMWIFDQDSFSLQVKDKLYQPIQPVEPTEKLLEFQYTYDYYNTVITGPFGYDVKYTGNSPETGGFTATKRGWLRWGKGNAMDGYMIFEIPKDSMPDDIALIGSFSRFGSAYWKFV